MVKTDLKRRGRVRLGMAEERQENFLNLQSAAKNVFNVIPKYTRTVGPGVQMIQRG